MWLNRVPGKESFFTLDNNSVGCKDDCTKTLDDNSVGCKDDCTKTLDDNSVGCKDDCTKTLDDNSVGCKDNRLCSLLSYHQAFLYNLFLGINIKIKV